MPGLIVPFRGVMPKIASGVFVADNATIIGDVEIEAGSSIWYGCVLRGDVNRIRIGRNTNIQDGTVIHCDHDPKGDYRVTGGGEPTLVGDNVTVGHMALLHACRVEDGAFIGMRSLVMNRVVVESGGMVAAGALISPDKVVKPNELWAGTPARKVRELRAEESAFIPYSAAHYARLAATYLAEEAARR